MTPPTISRHHRIRTLDDTLNRRWAALAATLITTAQLSLSISPYALGGESIVVVNGEHDVWSKHRRVASHGDLYIIEQDDITDDVMMYVWRDSNGDGARDRFEVIDGVARGWVELAGQ